MNIIPVIEIIGKLLLVFFLPGILTFLFFKSKNDFKLNIFEFLLVAILTSIVITSVVGSILVLLKYFYIDLLLFILALYSFIFLLGILILKKRVLPVNLKVQKKEVALVALLIVLAVIIFFKPFDPVVSYDDGHLNIAIGASLLKQHSIIYQDENLLSLNEKFRHFFDRGFTGLNIYDTKTATVEPSFFHWVHVWIAIILGITTSVSFVAYLFPFLGMLSILSLFFITKHLLNLKVALVSSFLLIFSFPQIWFSRYPGNTEIPFQLLLFGGLFLFVLFLKSQRKFYSIFSGLLFGLLFILRIDSALIIPPLLFFLIFIYFFNLQKKNYHFFYIVLSLMFLYSVLFNYATAKTYSIVYFKTISVKELSIGLIFTLFLFVILVIFKHKEIFKKLKYHLIKYKNVYKNIFISSCILIFLFLFLTSSTEIYFRNQYNRLMMGWYLTFPVMFIGIFFIPFLIYKKINYRLLLVLIFLSFSIFYLHKLHNRNIHPWAMRRYIIATIPFIYIGFSYFLFKISKLFKNKKPVMGLFIIIFLSTVSISSKLFTFVEFENTSKQCEEIFTEFNDKDTLIFLDWSNNRLTYPAKFFLDKNIFAISRSFQSQRKIYEDPKQLALFKEMLNQQLENKKRLFLINLDGEFHNILSQEFDVSIYKSESVAYAIWSRTKGRFTDFHSSIGIDVIFYQIELKSS